MERKERVHEYVIEEYVVDTNVALTANGAADQASVECEGDCVRALKKIQAEGRTLLDEGGQIIEEYGKRLRPSGQPGTGDAFFKWLRDNQGQLRHCRIVPVTVDGDRGFVEFPDDPRLASFDPDDRKFVAVALASGTGPKVYNATDTDWWHARRALEENGVDVHFLCPELMKIERR